MRSYYLVVLMTAVVLTACTATGPNPDPIKGIPYERTSRLLEMRAELAQKNAAYATQTGDRLNRNTNKRNLGELRDEYANLDNRAQGQIERELVRRYQAGETAAYFPGLEQVVPGATAPTVPATGKP